MSAATSTHPAPAPASVAPGGRSPAPVDATCLGPDEAFPTELAELDLEVVQVLHSRICCQLEGEYRTVEGPHPVTLDRCEELREELDTRRYVMHDPATGQ